MSLWRHWRLVACVLLLTAPALAQAVTTWAEARLATAALYVAASPSEAVWAALTAAWAAVDESGEMTTYPLAKA